MLEVHLVVVVLRGEVQIPAAWPGRNAHLNLATVNVDERRPFLERFAPAFLGLGVLARSPLGFEQVRFFLAEIEAVGGPTRFLDRSDRIGQDRIGLAELVGLSVGA